MMMRMNMDVSLWFTIENFKCYMMKNEMKNGRITMKTICLVQMRSKIAKKFLHSLDGRTVPKACNQLIRRNKHSLFCFEESFQMVRIETMVK